MEYTPLKFGSTSEREDYLHATFADVLGARAVNELICKGFCIAPASTKYHGAYEGGLFDHSVNVAAVLKRLTINNNLEWGKATSPDLVGILHDLCKIDQYLYDPNSCTYQWNNDVIVKGHGIKSVIYTYELLSLGLTAEEQACILYHMGAFTEKEEWKDYNAAINKFPNVLWTHTADMIVSQIMEV